MNIEELYKRLDASINHEDPAVIAASDEEGLCVELAAEMIRLREEAGLTQTEMAKRLSVRKSHVSKLETAYRGPHSIEHVMRYLSEFGARLVVGVQHGGTDRWVSDTKPILTKEELDKQSVGD